MKKFLTILTILLSFCLSAFARIGETPEECIKRYGEPESKLGEPGEDSIFYMTFDTGDFKINVSFLNGKAGLICYGKSRGGELSLSDIEHFLKVNNLNGQWKETTGKFSVKRNWESEGLHAWYYWYQLNQNLFISTSEYTDYIWEAQKKHEKAAREGL